MNGKQHRQIGAAAGAIYTVAKYFIQKSKNPDTKFSWGELALNAGIGYAAGTIPDLLEPAIHSHHRKFFHSVAAGTAVTYGAFGKHTNSWNNAVKKPVQAAAVAYVSHLAADATTPRGIALVHPKII